MSWLDAEAYVYCSCCGAQFDLSDFDLPSDADHGDYVEQDCPSCGAFDGLRVQG